MIYNDYMLYTITSYNSFYQLLLLFDAAAVVQLLDESGHGRVSKPLAARSPDLGIGFELLSAYHRAPRPRY